MRVKMLRESPLSGWRGVGGEVEKENRTKTERKRIFGLWPG